MNFFQEKMPIVIHLGELTLKGKNRKWFEDILVNNIRANLSQISPLSIQRQFGRIMLEFAGAYDRKTLFGKLSKVFGIANFAPAIFTDTSLANIEKTVLLAIEGRQFRSFAVRARRIEKRLPYTSQEVNEKIGLQVCRLTGSQVNLDDPELTLWIDILSEGAYIYVDKIKGALGLPTGTSGKVACLISGGIDSPVAAWRLMRRGCIVDFIHFHSAPFTNAASQEKVSEIVDILNEWQCGRGRLLMVPFGDIQRKIVTSVPEKYRVILYRRFMMRVAEAIAKELKCEALVTGEALGQVASQTLSNMATVSAVVGIPILRPLVGLDKQEIVDLSKEIGTYQLSIEPHQDCCQFLEPRHPVTHSTHEELLKVEENLDIEALVKEGLTGVEWIGNK